ncbi:MAG TPA: DUF4381 domain-containing protein [Tepidisphaeraceae bacterium]|jgi:hypothetical protein
MSAADLTSLDRLHDVVAPPPVPWWPPAPGWRWLIGILLALALYAAIRAFIHWQQNRYRREALAACRAQTALLADPSARAAALSELAVLLKRAALSAFPRPQVAALTGPAWLSFLDRTAAMHGFNSQTGALLEHAAYGSIAVADLDEPRARRAASLVHLWLTHHRAAGGEN